MLSSKIKEKWSITATTKAPARIKFKDKDNGVKEFKNSPATKDKIKITTAPAIVLLLNKIFWGKNLIILLNGAKTSPTIKKLKLITAIFKGNQVTTTKTLKRNKV